MDKTNRIYDVIVVGGGAAGFFFAINCKKLNPSFNVLILEKSGKVLGKVKVSGGGRCNVTHACFEPKELVKFYPRGGRELIGPFHKFQPGDTIGWFAEHNVELKIEDDGRMFPVSDSSQTIIDCFLSLQDKLQIPLHLSEGMNSLEFSGNNWQVSTDKSTYQSKRVFMATGSSPRMWQIIGQVGHTIVEPVPSLFTFNIRNPLLKDLMGISVPVARVTIPELKLEEFGPVLITHWGLSGPGILKLSSVAARELAARDYKFEIHINWTGYDEKNDVYDTLVEKRRSAPKQKPGTQPLYSISKRFWHRMLQVSGVDTDLNWGDLSNAVLDNLAGVLAESQLTVTGKSTFKEEFVTAGGVELKEIDFRTMESKICPGLFFAGEVLNIDALTGGFNFQAAWTCSWIAAQRINGNDD